MRKTAARLGLAMVILALAAGFFYYFQTAKSRDMSQRGTLVKHICGGMGEAKSR